MADDKRYGNGNPPYSLYQGEGGLWGLVDKDGVKLPAVFKRTDDSFSCACWEVVSFSPNEGFELVAWYDPSEAWFNFTFDDPRYPDEFAGSLWKKPERDFEEYETEIRQILPGLYWLFDSFMEANRILDIEDDDECNKAALSLLGKYPQLNNIAEYNECLNPIMRNDAVPEDMKIALWQAKVKLDDNIRLFCEDVAQYCNVPENMLNNTIQDSQ